MATLTMEAGSREITLRYTVGVIVEAEEAYGSMDRLLNAMRGDEKPDTAALDLIAFMANAHEKHEKRKPIYTRSWLRDNLTPKQLEEAKIMTQYAIMVGMRRDVNEDEDIPIDDVLKEIEEENKKKLARTAKADQLPGE